MVMYLNLVRGGVLRIQQRTSFMAPAPAPAPAHNKNINWKTTRCKALVFSRYIKRYALKEVHV
jgi:hypothetical protein